MIINIDETNSLSIDEDIINIEKNDKGNNIILDKMFSIMETIFSKEKSPTNDLILSKTVYKNVNYYNNIIRVILLEINNYLNYINNIIFISDDTNVISYNDITNNLNNIIVSIDLYKTADIINYLNYSLNYLKENIININNYLYYVNEIYDIYINDTKYNYNYNNINEYINNIKLYNNTNDLLNKQHINLYNFVNIIIDIFNYLKNLSLILYIEDNNTEVLFPSINSNIINNEKIIFSLRLLHLYNLNDKLLLLLSIGSKQTLMTSYDPSLQAKINLYKSKSNTLKYKVINRVIGSLTTNSFTTNSRLLNLKIKNEV